MNLLTVPDPSRTYSNISNFSFATATSSTSGSASRVGYSYQLPPVASHPSLMPPTTIEVESFVSSLSKGGKKLQIDEVWKVGYTAAHVAASSKNNRSNKLIAIKELIKSSDDPVKVAGAAYEVAKQWGNLSRARLDQSKRLLLRAINNQSLYASSNPHKNTCVPLIAMAMSEVTTGMTIDNKPSHLFHGLQCLQDFLRVLQNHYNQNPQLLQQFEIDGELRKIAENVSSIQIPSDLENLPGMEGNPMEDYCGALASIKEKIVTQFHDLAIDAMLNLPLYSRDIPHGDQLITDESTLPRGPGANQDIAPF